MVVQNHRAFSIGSCHCYIAPYTTRVLLVCINTSNALRAIATQHSKYAREFKHIVLYALHCVSGNVTLDALKSDSVSQLAQCRCDGLQHQARSINAILNNVVFFAENIHALVGEGVAYIVCGLKSVYSSLCL